MAGFLVTVFLFYLAWSIFLLRRPFSHFQKTNTSSEFVSVIVAAHNEEINLPHLLESLQNQTYPLQKFEIILVDDRSTDASSKILLNWQKKMPNLRVLRVEKKISQMPAKKFALTQGIQHSKGRILFFTDADCIPSQTWISSTLSYFTPETGIVVGFAPLKANTKKLLPKLLEIESVFNSLVARSGISWNIPMTATGRNLAYRKSVFNQVNGFETIAHSISGDDDLFLHLVHEKTSFNMQYANTPQSNVISFPPTSWKHFFRQRVRHFSAGKYYNPLSQVIYAVFHASNSLLLISPIFLIWSNNISLIISLLFIKFCIDFSLLFSFGKTFKYKMSLQLLILWEYFYLAEVWIIGVLSHILPVTWKETQTIGTHAK